MNKKEKLLIIGSDSKWAIERFYNKELKKYFIVDFFNAHGRYLKHYHASVKNKIINRLGLSSFIKRINRELLSLYEKKHFDIVLVFKGMELYPETIQKMKTKGAYLINYNPDHPFEFLSRGSGNKNVLNSIKYYDHHFSYSKKIVSDLQEKYSVSASWLPFAFASSQKPVLENEKYNRLCFIGNPDRERASIIQKLVDEKIPVDVFGNNWQRFLKAESNLKLNNAVYAEDFVETAQSYRLHINILRKQNFDSHNMRTFEMPAIGCITLSQRTSEQLEFFQENTEAFYYDNSMEMIQQAKSVLAYSPKEAYAFKVNAYNRSVCEKYSYKNRTQVISSFLSNRNK